MEKPTIRRALQWDVVTKPFPSPSVGALNTCHKWFNQVVLGKGSQARIALGLGSKDGHKCFTLVPSEAGAPLHPHESGLDLVACF